MRVVCVYALFFALLGFGHYLANRSPSWLTADPILHPFGRELLLAAQSQANRGGFSDATDSISVAFPLNLSEATVFELRALPGIGPKIAARIVAHRDSSSGSFDLSALEEVRGIGPKKLAAMAPLIESTPDTSAAR